MLPVNGEGNVSGDTTVRSPVDENALPDEIVPFHKRSVAGRNAFCGYYAFKARNPTWDIAAYRAIA